MRFADQVTAAIGLLGGSPDDPVVDFLADPGAACRALDAAEEHGAVVARVAPELGPAPEGHGPAPLPPLWIRLMRGAREVGTASLRGADGMVRRVERVEIDEREEPCCDAPTCERRRTSTAVWMALEPVPDHDGGDPAVAMGAPPPNPRPASGDPGSPSRILVAEQQTMEGSPAIAHAVAARLSAALGVPLRRGEEEVTLPPGEAPAPLSGAVAMGETPLQPIGAASLARFALRSEGSLRVLRDWDSVGPRASATRNGWIGAVLLVAAAAAWVQLFRSIGGAGGWSASVGAGAAAALLTLAGYAFAGVARFSARYRATSAPLVAVGRDRIVVLPWVGRDGAVDTRPEGRLGAAISLGEVRGATPRPHGEGVAVELDTDHGRIDALVCPDTASAELWCAALVRAVDEARHPRQGASARQRARQRAAA